MRKLALYVLVTIFLMQTFTMYSQAPGKPAPGFNLTISEVHPGGMIPNVHTLLVEYTNTSKVDYHPNGCWEFRGMYNMIVLSDGIPAKETDNMRKLRKFRDGANCFEGGGLIAGYLKPGKTSKEYLEVSYYYDMTKPGTYEITVTRETFPWNPEKSVTVKSNTLTIVVPEPGSTEPQ
jgi:hypothetical protein